MAHDIPKVERQLERINKLQAELLSVNLSEELLKIIHRPGWTTVAEWMFVSNALDALTHTLEGQIQESKQLLMAAKEVSPAGRAISAA